MVTIEERDRTKSLFALVRPFVSFRRRLSSLRGFICLLPPPLSSLPVG